MRRLPYAKLPGKARTLVTTSRLWLGEDHILLVKSTRIVEEYRRFYFPDVQAIVIRRSMAFHYGWTAFLFGATLLVGSISRSVPATFLILAGSALFLWLRGPSAVCHLYTAVQKEHLPSLHRLRTAERVLELLRERIEERQGAVRSISELPQPSGSQPFPGPPPLPAASQPASHLPHFLLFSVLLTSAAIAAYALVYPVDWARAAAPIASLIEFLFLIPVLAWQTGKRFSKGLKIATWVAVARWFSVQFPAWTLQYKAAIVDKTSRDISPWALPVADGWIGWLNFISLLLVGVAGAFFAVAAPREGANK